MSRVGAVGAAVAVVLAGVLVVSTDAALSTTSSAAWLERAGLSRSGEPVEPRSVAAVPTSVQLACPAAPRLAAEATGTDVDFSAQPVPTTARVRALAAATTTSDLQVLPLTAADGTTTIPAPVVGVPTGDLATARSDGARSVTVVGSPAEGVAPQPAAVESAVTTAGDLRGLSAGVCSVPASTTWLVGGGLAVGRSNRLVLANPGSTPAAVALTVLTSTGPQQPAAGRGLLVPAGQELDVLVEGLVAPDPVLAVGVTATGGTVAASLVDTALSGVTPGGVDVVTGSTVGTRHVLAGIPPTDTAVLRIAVPGDAPAAVGWRLEGVDGPVLDDAASAATVPAGSVVDVPLRAVASGYASVVVESDVPVLAAVQLTRAGPASSLGAVDRAWMPSAPALDGVDVLALPADGVAAELVLTAADRSDTGDGAQGDGAQSDGAQSDGARGDGTAGVSVVPLLADGRDGARVELTVVPGTTSVVPATALDGAVGVRLEVASGAVHAGVVLSTSSGAPDAGADLLSTLAVPPRLPAPSDVVLRDRGPDTWP